MTHTQTVALILDATRPAGILFHTLSESQRNAVRDAGREYATGHATGNRARMEDGERRVIETVRVQA